MSSCSVSMKWKMCFSYYTIRQNNPRTHIYFMYYLLLNLKYNICHWSKNLWSVAGRNDDTHPVCQGKNHKVTYFEKCPHYSLKIHVFLCPFFITHLMLSVYKCPGHQVIHIVNLWQQCVFLCISNFCFTEIPVVSKFSITLITDYTHFMHITIIRIFTEKHSGRGFALSGFFGIADITKLLDFTLICAI